MAPDVRDWNAPAALQIFVLVGTGCPVIGDEFRSVLRRAANLLSLSLSTNLYVRGEQSAAAAAA